MIQITNQHEVLDVLNTLTNMFTASFGKMTSQHMIEHLILTLKISANKLPHPSYFREEKATSFKNAIIYSSIEMPLGFRAPMLTAELLPLVHPSLSQALIELNQELTYFQDFFKMHPNLKTINPSMGELNHDEWIIFHNKHFHIILNSLG